MGMVQNHYEINVSKGEPTVGGALRYIHLFATAERSCVGQYQLEKVYAEIKARFPSPEYRVDVSEVRCTGHHVDPTTWVKA
jgi:hypothetical protein